ncbi:hypothetical protein GLOIN_2v1589073 [Rhizophagus irregularis DAOM 181602=DAOM 197198]|uniref:Uncharacterized protein n=1 Tax=Rhizophagus irregularis (strain DAOM 181602 / DAOM 197198 / MUCL 43194) TaxID=747089 RepID=A0A2P4Q6E2_RHIID|nr:hypothetical protein GLOIN_2v1589073 [Rhizophagus irregularis DAOM 181602=DAOM 197198]POG73215.1 hypothetical protein GLOIN_2v1589073 [Rhizophagus irregularis DAOM 181602=DAOM 197198]|eukprot:XP_025180081.1 hypothetical protein GLOIN_2v1589073 [Rhizophagus irregularis DAOM 181602=DAOM 197198]
MFVLQLIFRGRVINIIPSEFRFIQASKSWCFYKEKFQKEVVSVLYKKNRCPTKGKKSCPASLLKEKR